MGVGLCRSGLDTVWRPEPNHGGGYGRGCGVGRTLGNGVGRGVAVGVAVGVGVGVPHGVSMYVRDSFCVGEAGGQMQKSSV